MKLVIKGGVNLHPLSTELLDSKPNSPELRREMIRARIDELYDSEFERPDPEFRLKMIGILYMFVDYLKAKS